MHFLLWHKQCVLALVCQCFAFLQFSQFSFATVLSNCLVHTDVSIKACLTLPYFCIYNCQYTELFCSFWIQYILVRLHSQLLLGQTWLWWTLCKEAQRLLLSCIRRSAKNISFSLLSDQMNIFSRPQLQQLCTHGAARQCPVRELSRMGLEWCAPQASHLNLVHFFLTVKNWSARINVHSPSTSKHPPLLALNSFSQLGSLRLNLADFTDGALTLAHKTWQNKKTR